MIDGFISTSAALWVPVQSIPDVRDKLVFSHQSAEAGHQLALAHLKCKTLVNIWDCALEKARALRLCLPILNAAATVLAEMATFEQAGVSTKS